MDEGEKSLNASELRQAIDKADNGRRNFDSDDEFIAQKKQGVTGALSDDSDNFMSPIQTPDKRERERPSSLKLDIIENAQNNQ